MKPPRLSTPRRRSARLQTVAGAGPPPAEALPAGRPAPGRGSLCRHPVLPLLDRVGRHRTIHACGLVDRQRHLKNMLCGADVLCGLASGEEAVDEVSGRAVEAEPP